MRGLLISALCLLLPNVPVCAEAQALFRSAPLPVDGQEVILNQGRLLVAMNVGDGRENMSASVNGVSFQGGGRQGLTQTRTGEGVTVQVRVDDEGQQANQLAVDLYPNDTSEHGELFRLLNSGFISNAGSGLIEIRLSGLTPGLRYRLQTVHLLNTGSQGSREMVMRVDEGDSSKAFEQIYRNGGVAEAVSHLLVFTATGAEHIILLSPKDYQQGIDRAYLNGLALFSIQP